MTLSLKHNFHSTKSDSVDSTLVNPSNWNDEHVYTAAPGVVVGRNAGSSGAIEELPISVDATKQSMTPPSGNSGARPGSPTAGMMRYNTTLARLEKYINGGWVTMAMVAVVATSAPTNPQPGDFWFDTTVSATPSMKSWDGAAWQLVTPVQTPSNSSAQHGTATNTVDALRLAFSPASTSLTTNERVYWTSIGPNTVLAPTLSKNVGVTTKTIKKGNSLSLVAGDTGPVGYECEAVYNGTDWILVNPATQQLSSVGNNTLSGVNTFAGNLTANSSVVVKEQTITYAASVTFDPSVGADAVVTLTGAIAFGAIANQSSIVGARGQIRIIEDGTGGRAATWDTTIVMSDGSVPSIDISPNAETVFNYWVKAGSGAGSVVLTARTGYRFQQRAAQATTSGTSITFSNIPAWAKRLTLIMNQVSTNGTSTVLVRLGTAGGVVATGYNANGGHFIGGASSTVVASVVGFPFDGGGNASDTIVGAMRIVNISGTLWIEDASTSISPNNRIGVSGGSVDPAAAVTTVTLTTVNGTDAFDAGSVSLLIEG